ncbi:MLO-like protein 9 [Chenopodium quinoa]|uniref:MLO-like protein 9 n=1 Tax=Chenopodium quinoa TaxID=63459 RepID=UPI000B775709|nr:MLO-like protein 9 [Chenopodium quinoa]
MGGGGGGGGSGLSKPRELDQTPTWAVASVCAIIILISIVLEKVLHLIGSYFHKNHKKALFEALEKVKAELMVLGFISLLLTFGQNYIISICIPLELADTMLPCAYKPKSHKGNQKPAEGNGGHHRRLLWYEHRMLGGGGAAVGCKEGFVPLISANGLHQLHIFIFFLAVFHVLYSCITMALGRMKIRRWKDWELEAVNSKGSFDSDAAKFRLTHETSFVKGHSSFWTKNPILFALVCFLRQFYRTVRKSDYLALRHGFVSVHLAPGSKFDFQKYIKRSLEDDFKVVVGISPLLWASAVFFLLLNVDKWDSMVWLSFLPLIVILSVGMKLQAVITRMAVEITERHAVIQGMPLVQVSDKNFWFGWPQLILYLIHYVLFQNAFEITYFFWIWYEFGLRSCFHSNFAMTIVRVCLGVAVQFMCCYITLPLYALVTQMGSTMKRSIFDEQTSKALTKWRKNAKKKNDGKPGPVPTQVLGGSPKHNEMADMTTVDLQGEDHPDHDHP